MKFILFILLFTLPLFALKSFDGNIGVLRDGIADTKTKDYAIAFELLIQKIGFKRNIIMNLTNYDDVNKITNDFTKHKLDYIMINPYYFLGNQEKLAEHAALSWAIRKGENKFYKMVILARKDFNIKNVTDLKNKKVILKNDNYLGKMVLNKTLLESKEHHIYKGYIDSLMPVKTNSRAILQLYFKKADVAVVPKFIYDFMSEMNPDIKMKIKIIHETEPVFISLINMLHIDTPKDTIKKMMETTYDLHTTVDGKNVFNLFKMKRMDAVSNKELQKLKNYYNEYMKLKKKYSDVK